MKTIEVREKFIKYFESKGLNFAKPAPIVPQNDNSVLFTTAGMQQFVPYLTGKEDPWGGLVVNYQPCIRTNDIDEVGDSTHLTFFEMLGNWSFGKYFKKEAINMSYEFLINVLGFPKSKIAVTCFEGDENAPKDEESAKIWMECGIDKERVFFLDKNENWWIAGDHGPCGPDTEIFYEMEDVKCDSKNCTPACDCGRYVEIWNNVFMEYFKDANGNYSKLEKKNVDAGMGLERMAMIINGVKSPFELDIFKEVINTLDSKKKNKSKDCIVSERIIADHLRTSMMIISYGVRPSNVDRGYILRRLIRRIVRSLRKLEIEIKELDEIIDVSINSIKDLYPEVLQNKSVIKEVIFEEVDKFHSALDKGEKELEKIIESKKEISSEEAFMLYERFGLPIEITEELAKEKNVKISLDNIDKLFEEHKKASKQGEQGKFKGGLKDHSPMSIKYHTATHLLQAALRKILGEDVFQRGSNINEERLRFDFSYPEKVDKEKLQEIEDLVNEMIKANLEVSFSEMPLEEAKKKNVIGIFEDRYKDIVKVYTIGDVSKEICGGPHVKNTGELGHFKITKEEASSKGVRRIRAILED